MSDDIREECVLDILRVNFAQMLREGWLRPSDDNLPSPSSYREVLLVLKECEGRGVRVVTAAWSPENGYRNGVFKKHDIEIPLADIHLYRTLSFIPAISISEDVDETFKAKELNNIG